ncbi:ABC1 kinase family protein [Saccharothrix obliqua]|uniref:ABC1 kinase family protein n=1 Tax=Saccharothrix obliqua TaxID=2861747 RepID=UPI001C5F4B73|nr:AarF/UbiB family protein [Saccharothrix obliqua]MBW4717313.1 AarF/ABC1/UbiB kinase family protein [Saccharothrix obliqua]
MTLARVVRSGREQHPGSRRRAVAVRRALEALGPLYIKLGQVLSTRPDLVSAAMTDELATLHDNVPAAPFDGFARVLEEELGVGWRRGFRCFDAERPLGSASLAQVYRADMPDGRPVAVKVQRSGVRSVVDADMAVLRRAARWSARLWPEFNAVIDFRAMLDLIFDAVRGELDFTVEARQMEIGRKATGDFAHLTVPEVVRATPRVLVQDLAPGRSIRDAVPDEFTRHERLAIAHDLMAFMYRGYFVERIFHADPHPGNVFVAPGHPAALIDWGMVGRLDRPLSLKLALTLINIVQNDGDGAAKAWIEMGKPTRRADIGGFTSDVAALVPKAATATLAELDFGLTLTAVLRHSTLRGIKTNPAVPLLGKSFANMEGSIRCLAPELSAAEVFRDQLTDIMVDLACETLSEAQIARTMTELLLTADGSYNQARGILRDLADRELQLPVESGNGPGANPTFTRLALLAIAVAAVGYLRRGSSRHDGA